MRALTYWMSTTIGLMLISAAGVHAAAREQPLDRVAAVVNEDVITMSELDDQTRLIEQQIKQQGVQMPLPEVLRKQVLEKMIVDRVQQQIAGIQGVKVDDEALNQALANIAKQNNLSLQQFRDVLEKDGYVFTDFREQLRGEIATHRLRQRVIDDRVTVTESEVNDLLARVSPATAASEYHLAHILITTPEAASPEQIEAARNKAQKVLEKLRSGADFQQTAISVSEGQQALQGGDLGWRKAGELPGIFADVVPKMKPGEISDLIRSSSGFHIVKLLDMRSGTGAVKVEQALVRHIMVRTDNLTSDDKARARVRDLRARIAAGADFAAVARASSDDPNSAGKGGVLGWVSPGELPSPFPEIIAGLKPGELSEPFKTPIGWHILQVMERRVREDSGESRRAQAYQLLRTRKIEEETQAWLRRLRDEAYVEYRMEEPL